MSPVEYRLASIVLRVFAWLFGLLPLDRRKVVLATARVATLDGNLARIDAALRSRHPGLRYVHLLEPYGYGLVAKLAYLGRLVRGTYHLQTARLFIVDNAYLPIHVASHRPATTVVQVWHAVAALKRFGADTVTPLAEPERTFLHRNYDVVIAASEAARAPYAAALRTPIERVLPLGAPRTDFFFDESAMEAARARVLGAYPMLAGRQVVLYAPTFRGRGPGKRAAPHLDGRRLRDALPADYLLVAKMHPNLNDPGAPTAGFDLVVDPRYELNDLFTVTDVLVTDYSSSIFEYALLYRPLVLLVPDLAEYERDPGLYLDFRREMIGAQVADTTGVIAAVTAAVVDRAAYDAFIARHLGAADGRAAKRFVEHFLG
jgi:CDP-ribitol ribitolphosphotransferase